jgi:hypothetical protein
MTVKLTCTLLLSLLLCGCAARTSYPHLGAPPGVDGRCFNDHYENRGGPCVLKP